MNYCELSKTKIFCEVRNDKFEYKMLPVVNFSLICLHIMLIYTIRGAEIKILSCENRNTTEYLTNVYIASVGFPNTTNQVGCRCDITSLSKLNVFVKILLVKQHKDESNFPLTVSYTVGGQSYRVNSFEKFNMLMFEEGNMAVVKNSNNVSIDLKKTGVSGTTVGFVFHIQTFNDTTGKISVSCNSDETGKSNDDVLDKIEEYCSAYLLIILGSLSGALLIIILIISIILCCVMPKKQREKIAKIRQSVLLDSDVTFSAKQADRIRPDTVIYDDLEKTRSCYEPNIPMDYGRNLYANSNAQTNSGIYQNS